LHNDEHRLSTGEGDAMTGWPAQPVIYEINTAIWLDELSRAAGRPVTLADVPGSGWDTVTPAGVQAVWLMGVWERSPAGLALALVNPELQASFAQALPDLRAGDVIGSPYCVRRYTVDAAFGGPSALAVARSALAARGVRLLLDYVPNHVAPDHPWVTSNPELFVRGGETVADQVRVGGWELLQATGWPDNQSRRNLAAWSWAGQNGSGRHAAGGVTRRAPARALRLW
jgi:hypothetical protein